MKKIFIIGLMFLLMVQFIPFSGDAQVGTLKINQIDDVQTISTGDTASYHFQVINSGTSDKAIEIGYPVISGYSITLYPGSNFEVSGGDTVDVYVNITPSSRALPGTEDFDIIINNVNDRTIVDTLELTLIISLTQGIEITYVTNNGENDVYIQDNRGTEYMVQVKNLGNVATTYSFAISDMQLLDRVTAILGNWTAVTHKFSGTVPIGDDEIDDITLPAQETGLFYVTVLADQGVKIGEKLRFNLTLTSTTNSTVAITQQFTTTATRNAYDVNIVLLEADAVETINPNSVATFDIRVFGSDVVDETVRINIETLDKWADMGFVFSIYDDNDQLKGGFWEDPVNYEHPFDVSIPVDGFENYTIQVISPNAVNVTQGTEIDFRIVASVVESMTNRSVEETGIETSDLFSGGEEDPSLLEHPYFIWGVFGLIIIVVIVLVAVARRS